MMATFAVDRVVPATQPLPRGRFEELLVNRTGGVKPESYSRPNGVPVERLRGVNAFVAAVNEAYANHYPLVLTPDASLTCQPHFQGKLLGRGLRALCIPFRNGNVA